MTRRLTIAIVLATLFASAGVAYWWFARVEPEAVTPSASGPTTEEILEKKWAARRDAAQDSAPCQVRGRVTSSGDGTGIEGAVVTLARASAIEARRKDPILVRTGPTGEWSAEDVAPGRYFITATAAEHLPQSEPIMTLRPGREHSGVELGLEAGGVVLNGVVRNLDGDPLPGTWITFSPSASTMSASTRTYGTITDDEGRYGLWLATDVYSAMLKHRDHVVKFARLVVGDSGRTQDYELAPGGVVRGRVVDSEHARPVAAAIVALRDPGAAMGTPTTFASTGTDDEGRFELRGIPAGLSSLEVTATRHRSLQAFEVSLGVSEEREGVEIVVDPAFVASGFVVDASDETSGIQDVTVMATNFQGFASGEMGAPSEADGYFELQGLAPGRYIILAMGEDVIISAMAANFEIKDRDVTDLLIRMDRGVKVKGRLDPGGRARISASISPEEEMGGMFAIQRTMQKVFSTMRSARAEPDGTFEFGPVAPGKYILQAVAHDGRYAELSIEAGESPGAELALKTRPGVAVSGRVLDGNGQPVASIGVAFNRVREESAVDLSRFMGTGGSDDITAADGSFALAGLPPGEYTVSVRDDRLRRVPWDGEVGTASFLPKEIKLVSGSPMQLDLEVAARSPINGVVKGPDGEPIAGAWVRAVPELTAEEWVVAFDAGPASATTQGAQQLPPTVLRELGRAFAERPVETDDKGRFVTPPLLHGSYALLAEADGGRLRTAVDGFSSGADAELTLAPLGTVVIETAGGEAPGSNLRIRLDGPEVRMRLGRREDNAFTIDRLLPGTYGIEISADAGAAWSEVAVTAGASQTVTLPLRPWGRAEGRVVDLDSGEPVQKLAAMHAPGRMGSYADLMSTAEEGFSIITGRSPRVTDRDGRFVVERLGPGPHELRFLSVPEMTARGFTEFTTEAGESVDVGDVYALAPPLSDADRGTLGWDVKVADDDREPQLSDAPEQKWLTVAEVSPGGPAAAAGAKEGDVVVSVDGHDAQRLHLRALRMLLRPHHNRPGQVRKVVVMRDGKRVNLEITAAAG